MDFIYFDLNGVILKNPHVIKQGLFLLVSKFCDYETLKSQYNKYSTGEITRKEFWKSINVKNFKEVETRYLESSEVFPDFIPTVEKLKTKFKLGILSNYPKDWFEYIADKYNFKKYFNPVIVSCYEGIRKPDRRIFEIANNSVDFSKKYLIDNRLDNLEIAADFGMKTIWMNIEKEKSEYKPDYTIKSLTELERIFI